MDSSRWTKVKAYFSLIGIPESVNDLKLGVRRSFLGLPRKEITELINLLESAKFSVRHFDKMPKSLALKGFQRL
jgi:hypothetical protein